MEYQKAKAEVVLFDNSDVVTGSNCGNGNTNGVGPDKCVGHFADAQ